MDKESLLFVLGLLVDYYDELMKDTMDHIDELDEVRHGMLLITREVVKR